MAPQDANTAARRIYCALQTAYVGEPDERVERHLALAVVLAALERRLIFVEGI